MKYKLIFEKIDKEDFLDLPVIYSSKSGKSSKEIWEEYMKAYDQTRKKLDYMLENITKLKNQLEEDFNEFKNYIENDICKN